MLESGQMDVFTQNVSTGGGGGGGGGGATCRGNIPESDA